MSHSNPYETPPPTGAESARHVTPLEIEGDATGGIVPYKNPAALAAYYLAVFGMFPFLGIFVSIPAFVLGIIGLRQRKRNPVIKGSVHAWIGIILGGLATVINLTCIAGVALRLLDTVP